MQCTDLIIVEEARSWVNTPYRHQAACRGAGVDCVGLIMGVGMGTGLLDITEEAWEPFKAYSRQPNPNKMGDAMRAFLVELPPAGQLEPPLGSVIWFQWRENLPMHLGILSEFKGRSTIIHAYSQIGKCVEHDFSLDWRQRVHSYWQYPRI